MYVLEVKNLDKTFPGVKALNGVNLSIEKGEIRGLIGPNGSGKSTLISTIMGFYKQDKGDIYFNGQSINDLTIWERVGRGLNLTHQEALYVSGISIYRHIELGIIINGYPKEDILEIADIVGLTDMLYEDPSELSVLSSKKLEIAKAISTRPSVILLDECFAGLSHEEGVEIFNILIKLKELKELTMLIVDHNLSLVKLTAGITTVIDRGNIIAEGPFSDIISNTDVIEAYMG